MTDTRRLIAMLDRCLGAVNPQYDPAVSSYTNQTNPETIAALYPFRLDFTHDRIMLRIVNPYGNTWTLFYGNPSRPPVLMSEDQQYCLKCTENDEKASAFAQSETLPIRSYTIRCTNTNGGHMDEMYPGFTVRLCVDTPDSSFKPLNFIWPGKTIYADDTTPNDDHNRSGADPRIAKYPFCKHISLSTNRAEDDPKYGTEWTLYYGNINEAPILTDSQKRYYLQCEDSNAVATAFANKKSDDIEYVLRPCQDQYNPFGIMGPIIPSNSRMELCLKQLFSPGYKVPKISLYFTWP